MEKDTNTMPSESSLSCVPMDPNNGPTNLADELRPLSLAIVMPKDAAAILWRGGIAQALR